MAKLSPETRQKLVEAGRKGALSRGPRTPEEAQAKRVKMLRRFYGRRAIMPPPSELEDFDNG